MRKLFISTDSTADITPELRAAYDISIIPFSVKLQAQTVEDCIMLPAQTQLFIEKASKNGFFLQAPTVAQYEEFFDEMADKGGNILHISCGSSFSNAYSNALKAMKNTMVKFRKTSIYVVDSHSIGAGQALLLDSAVAYSHKNLPDEEIFVTLCECTLNLEQYFLLGDVTNYKNIFPSANFDIQENIKCNSLIEIDNSGKPLSPRKFMSFNKACKIIADSYEQKVADLPVYVYGSTDVDMLIKAVSALRRKGCTDIRMSAMGLANSTLLGTKAVSIAFVGNPRAAKVKNLYSPGRASDFFSPDED